MSGSPLHVTGINVEQTDKFLRIKALIIESFVFTSEFKTADGFDVEIQEFLPAVDHRVFRDYFLHLNPESTELSDHVADYMYSLENGGVE